MLSQCWKDTHNDLGDARVKFSNFLFPESRDPAHDGRVIDETLREARLTDELGFEVIWLAEHHFDGICAYVDPVSFAAALAVATQRAKIGFAVAQMSLHHPIRMAEQLALIDNISKGRLIVGLGRGTAYNIYDYQGYGLDHTEAQARFEEAEAIMFQAWRGEKFEHHGRFWDIKLPMLRPLPYTKPHPFVIRSASSEEGMLHIARQGRPFMMNVQSNEVTRQRMDLYRRTLRERAWTMPRSRATSSNVGCGATCSSPRPTRRPSESRSRRSRRCTSTARRCAGASMRNRACRSCRCRRRARRRRRGWWWSIR